MKLYHRTDAGPTILSDGFRDGEGTYLTVNTHRGVWLSNEPLDANDGAFGAYLLMLEIPQQQVEAYEWVEDSKGYREFLVPAEVVNQYRPFSIIDEDGLL